MKEREKGKGKERGGEERGGKRREGKERDGNGGSLLHGSWGMDAPAFVTEKKFGIKLRHVQK
jgi:hypothetical protein